MGEMFLTLGTWNWLIFGVILMALELLAPGVFLFWLGLAALLVGLLSFAFHPSWQIQILMFAVFAAAAVPLWRRIARDNAAASANPRFCAPRAPSRARSCRPRAAARPRSVMRRRASAPRKPRPRQRRWFRKPSPRATSPR